MNRKKHLLLTVLIVVVPGLIPGCGSNPQGSSENDSPASSGTRSGLPDPVAARALSRHYVVVTFPGPVGEEAEVADSSGSAVLLPQSRGAHSVQVFEI